EYPALAQSRAAVLERIAFGAQFLDPLVRRDGFCDFPADCRGVVEMDEVGRIRERPLRQVHEEFPLRPALPNPATRDFGREVDASLCRRLRASTALFVSSLRGEQEDCLLRFDEHLTRDDEVLMNPERNAFEGRADVLRLRQRLE